jgi:hypothetical protein
MMYIFKGKAKFTRYNNIYLGTATPMGYSYTYEVKYSYIYAGTATPTWYSYTVSPGIDPGLNVVFPRHKIIGSPV